MNLKPPAEEKQMFTKAFWQLCISSILFMMSFSMIISELSGYLETLGGKEYIGLIIGLFTLSAGLSRFWSGYLSDKIGRIPVIIFGSIVTMICGGLYILANSVFLFLLLRFIHGMSTGFRPTGSTALLSDMVSPKRRGEAMGFLGMAGSVGMAIGPAMGSVIRVEFGYDEMFLTSSGIGFLAFILSRKIPETHPNPRKFKLKDLNIFGQKVLDRKALPAAIIMMFDIFAFGVILTLIPDLVRELGFVYFGLFNLTFVITSIFIRFIAGRLSDRVGRLPILIVGSIVTIISLCIIALSTNIPMVVSGGIIYGVGLGLNRPTIFAWTTELSAEGNIAKGLSTMLLALEIGIGSGAVLSGFIYQGKVENIASAFWLAAAVCGLGLTYALWYGWSQRRRA